MPVRSIGKNTEHYTWGSRCDAWFLLKSEAFTVIQERMPPGSTEIFHKHGRSHQFFFVLSGEAVMTYGSEESIVSAGEGFEMQPTIPHKVRNDSRSLNLDFLVISCPPSHGDRFNLE